MTSWTKWVGVITCMWWTASVSPISPQAVLYLIMLVDHASRNSVIIKGYEKGLAAQNALA